MGKRLETTPPCIPYGKLISKATQERSSTPLFFFFFSTSGVVRYDFTENTENEYALTRLSLQNLSSVQITFEHGSKNHIPIDDSLYIRSIVSV